MIYITQLIYIKQGEELTFHQFEDIAIPIISKYDGQLLLRLRPSENEIIERAIESPYEVHIIKFDSDIDLSNFMKDEERKQFLHLKEKSIRTSILIKGQKL
jgi:uncharacterized protein (DUF1330 family)